MLAYDSMSSKSSALCDIDRKLITLTQAGLPLVTKPFHQLAQQLDITPEQVKFRFQYMLDQGIIRRIAAVPNHYALGFKTNGMTVWDVVDDKVQTLGNTIGNFDFVSHCYHRPRHLPEWRYNLFAMVHGKDRSDVDEHIEQIKAALGSDNRASDVLFSTRILKKTGLRIRSE